MLHEAITKRRKAEGRAASLRVGVIAAAIYNTAGKVSKKKLRPSDFVRSEPTDLGPDGFRERMLAWARANAARGVRIEA